MAPRPRWWHTLQESRRQACLAIDFYNRPSEKRSYLDFVVHMHLAWQFLLHASFERDKIDYLYRDAKGRVQKTKDGDKKTWDLQRCVEETFAAGDPARLNIEFFIGLRNKIEHRYQDSFILATGGRAHALVINYETELVARFGDGASLAHELRFPLFVQSLTPAGMEEQKRLRKKLPRAAKAYMTKFEAKIDTAVKDSERYEYRVALTPVKGPRTDADLAVTFVREDELTPAERAAMTSDGKTGKVLVAEKQRDVLYKDELLPKQIIAEVDAQLPFKFHSGHFIQLWKKLGVRPKPGEPKTKTDTRYCVYNPLYDNYVYRKPYVERIIQEVGTREKFKAVFGKEPEMKVTALADRAAGKPDAAAESAPRPA